MGDGAGHAVIDRARRAVQLRADRRRQRGAQPHGSGLDAEPDDRRQRHGLRPGKRAGLDRRQHRVREPVLRASVPGSRFERAALGERRRRGLQRAGRERHGRRGRHRHARRTADRSLLPGSAGQQHSHDRDRQRGRASRRRASRRRSPRRRERWQRRAWRGVGVLLLHGVPLAAARDETRLQAPALRQGQKAPDPGPASPPQLHLRGTPDMPAGRPSRIRADGDRRARARRGRAAHPQIGPGHDDRARRQSQSDPRLRLYQRAHDHLPLRSDRW